MVNPNENDIAETFESSLPSFDISQIQFKAWPLCKLAKSKVWLISVNQNLT